jgi:hypothetical protein
MASQDDGYDYFSGSDLDDLPHNALDELENNAILHTQHFTQATQIINAPPSSDYGDGPDDEDLDDAVVFDEAQGVPERLLALQPASAGLATQREQFRKGRYGGPVSVRPLAERTLKQNINLDNRSVQQEAPVIICQNETSQGRERVVPKEAMVDPTIEALQKQVQEVRTEDIFDKQSYCTNCFFIATSRARKLEARSNGKGGRNLDCAQQAGESSKGV